MRPHVKSLLFFDALYLLLKLLIFYLLSFVIFYNNLVLFGVNTSVVVALLEPFVRQPHVEVTFSTFYIKANEAISPAKAMPAVNATELAELPGYSPCTI